MLDNLRFDDDSPIRFEHIVEKEKYWLCVNCNIVRILIILNILCRCKIKRKFIAKNVKFLDL